MQDVPGLAEVLAPDGWANASSASLGAGDPGRYNCLFGRDSLITALAVLPARPDVARRHAARAGRDPGHARGRHVGRGAGQDRPRGAPGDLRRAPGLPRARGARRRAALLRLGRRDAAASCTCWRRPATRALAAELEPAWRAAGDWLLGALERGGGLLRWHRRAPGGLAPAGLARHRRPVARTARRRRAAGSCTRTARRPSRRWPTPTRRRRRSPGCAGWPRLSGDPAHAAAAEALAARIGARVGPRDDGARRRTTAPVRGAGSQLGWLLWAGAPVAGAAERLAEPDVLTDFGLRTLSDRHPQLRPAVLPPRLGVAVRLVAGLGRAARRRARRRRPSACARACSRASSGIGHYPELYAVTDDGPEVGDGCRTSCRRGRSARVWALRNEWDGGAHVVA